jgi:hypothetical protein
MKPDEHDDFPTAYQILRREAPEDVLLAAQTAMFELARVIASIPR